MDPSSPRNPVDLSIALTKGLMHLPRRSDGHSGEGCVGLATQFVHLLKAL